MIESQKRIPILASLLAWCYIQLTGRTNWLRYEGPPWREILRKPGTPRIFTLWHSRVMLPIFHFRHRNLAVMVSRSKDGEYITQVMNRFDIHATRGSVSRHGVEGLLGLLRWLKEGKSVVITPDGPRGPREKVQKGTIQLARLSGVPITPVSFSCTRHHRFSSWDRFMLPLPVGSIYCVSGEPIDIPRDFSENEFFTYQTRVEEAMHQATLRADQLAGCPPLDNVS